MSIWLSVWCSSWFRVRFHFLDLLLAWIVDPLSYSTGCVKSSNDILEWMMFFYYALIRGFFLDSYLLVDLVGLTRSAILLTFTECFIVPDDIQGAFFSLMDRFKKESPLLFLPINGSYFLI